MCAARRRSPVPNGRGIEHDEVRERAGRDGPPIAQTEALGRQRGHLADHRLERQEPLSCHRQCPGERAVVPRMHRRSPPGPSGAVADASEATKTAGIARDRPHVLLRHRVPDAADLGIGLEQLDERLEGSSPRSCATAARCCPCQDGRGAVTSTMRSQPTPSTEDWNPGSPTSTAARRRERSARRCRDIARPACGPDRSCSESGDGCWLCGCRRRQQYRHS